MTRPLTALSRFAAFLGLVLGAFAWVLNALSSIASDPPARMDLGRGGEPSENTPESAPGPAVEGPARSRHLRVPGLAALLAWARRRRRLATVLAVLAVFGIGVGLYAFFTAGATAGSGGQAKGGTLVQGITPSLSPTSLVAGTNTTTLTLTQSTLNGTKFGTLAGGGYLVTRYAVSAPSTPVAPDGTCNVLITGGPNTLSCHDDNIPTGRWQYTITNALDNWRSTESAKSSVVTVSPAAPTSVSFVNGGGAGNAFINSGNVASLSFDVALPASSVATDTITLTLTDPGPAHTVTATAAGTAGAGTVHFTLVNGSTLNQGTITISAKATSSDSDNSTSSPSITRTKDTVNPTNSLTLASQLPAGSSLLSGISVFYRGSGGGSGGSFKVSNAVADSGSGPVSSATAALGGTTTNWTHTASTVSTPSGGPYVSNTFSWTEGATSSPTEVVTGADAAGNTTAAPTLTFVNDSTAPAGGSITANSGATYNTTGTVSLSKVDFTDAGGSGTASNVITRATGTLTNNVCGGLNGATVVTISAGNDPSSLASGCYQYTLTGTDAVGNKQTALSTVVKVDTSLPSTPTLAFSNVSGNALFSSGFNTLYIRPSSGGTFTVTAASTDADTGIQGYTFNSLNTNSGSNFGGSQTADHFDYTFGASTTAPTTARTVFSTNNASANSANASYSIVSDTTPPAGGSVTANSGAAFNTSGTVSLSKVNFAETQSAAASGLSGSTNVITRASATLTNNVCGSLSGAVVVSTPSDTVPSDGCYQYTLTAVDNVGNQTTATSTVVKVDTVKPSTSDNTASIGNAWKNTTQTVTLSPTDASSGVATTYYTTDGSTPTTGSTQGTSISLSTTGVYTIKYFTVDNAGNQEAVQTAGIQIRIDKVLPTSALSMAGSPTPVGAFLAGTTLYFKSNASGSFKLVNTVADANSGPASATFPLVTAATWTHAAETVTGSSPYTSSTYSWTTGAGTPSGAEATFTSADVATNTSANTVLTFTPDTAAPSGGSVSVPARVHATSVAVTFSAGTDPLSGVNSASGQLQRASATYTVSTDTCGSLGLFTNVGAAGPTSPFTDSTVANNTCYQYQYVVSDNVGNQVTYTGGTVKVDTTAPTASSIASNPSPQNGKSDSGDQIIYTFSEQMDPNSILSGWNGSSTSVTAHFAHCSGSSPDCLTITGVNLGSVALNGTYVATGNKFYDATATMVMTTVSGKSVVTIQLTNSPTTDVLTDTGAHTMTWTPVASATDLAGNACSTTSVNETAAKENF